MPYQLLNFRRSIKQSFSMQKQPPKVFYKKGFLNPNKAGLLKIAFFLGGRGVKLPLSLFRVKNFAKFTRKQLCQSLFLIKLKAYEASNFLLKQTVAQVFSKEFCEIF